MKIEITDNYRIERDSHSWVLIFSEIRQKDNKETKLPEDYLFEDKWYYPDIKQCLKKVLELDLKEAENFKELSLKVDELILKINSLKNTIFKP